MMRFRRLWMVPTLLIVLLARPLIAAESSIDFAQQVAPLFAEHCLRCHAAGNAKGEFSLTTFADLKANDFVVAGDPDASYLIELVTSREGVAPEMPQQGNPLSEAEVALLRHWISAGANWPEDVIVREKSKADSSWWAYQELNSDQIVNHNAADFSAAEMIDAHIVAELDAQGLEMNAPADRRTLIRRASYDLIGLPPTPEQVDAFVHDSDPLAYEHLIDGLLASPHYGERWGRHWLDVVRFGESNGFERNVVINDLWPFRDYVIRSINADKPFDQFIREHLAGDVIGADDPDLAVGSAFLVAGPYDDVGNQDAAQAAQIRANTLDEIIGASGEAFLGMTLGCARCHDHKFDPITQEDYYGLYATFAGIRHGSVPLATAQARAERDASLEPLNRRKSELDQALNKLDADIAERGRSQQAEYATRWTREPINRTGTEDRFDPINTKFIRLICESQDGNPAVATGFGIDEFEIWSSGPDASNVALAERGAVATGDARGIEDFPGAYGPQHAIDGKSGERFLSTGNHLTIELASPTLVDRIVFSSARGETNPDHNKFTFVAEYRIEASLDGQSWQVIATSADRKPIDNPALIEHRLKQLATNDNDRLARARMQKEIAALRQEISMVPPLPTVWIGNRVAADAKGPFHVFLGGSPQKPGAAVTPAGLSVLTKSVPGAGDEMNYRLDHEVPESERRRMFAEWVVDDRNPLTPRVLANRIWHYHFGIGIVDTPSDFGYMGGRPSHPALLDALALQLKANRWHLKPMHRMIMLSKTYQQSSDFRSDAAKIDGDSRLLWRFPPRRLSAEEVRDTMLQVADQLDTRSGGPGFRLYHFMQDNVCTYVPLEIHGPETYRRAVYHQNARASVVDLMTEFDQPDCAFSTPKRAETTTPLQALTMLNHSLTMAMADAMATRLRRDVGEDTRSQICRAYELCYSRLPSPGELESCLAFVNEQGSSALCRVLLNTSELISLK